MSFSVDNLCGGRLAKSRFSSALLWLAAFVLALQLIASGFHKHDIAEQSSDCVSCQIAAHFPADLPAVGTALQAVFLVVAYRLARLPQYYYVAEQSYLIPPRQAPPRHSSFTR